MKLCSVKGCKRKHRALSYCSMHLQRFHKHGSSCVDRPSRYDWSAKYEIDEITGCWNWLGSIMKNGYGVDTPHRTMWKRERGPIPAKMTIDHLCRNRKCINPNHLEVVTQAENVQRGAGAKLNWFDVHNIRKMAGDSIRRSLIQWTYQIRSSHLSSIISHKSWKEIA